MSSTVTSGFNIKVGVSAEFVSAELDFNVQESFSVTWSSSIDVPRGKCLRLRGYAIYQDWKGDIFSKFATDAHWTYRGWVRAWNFDGIGFGTEAC